MCADTPDAARSLGGLSVAVREGDLGPLGESEYYEYQLVGLSVVDAAGRPIGSVREVIHRLRG